MGTLTYDDNVLNGGGWRLDGVLLVEGDRLYVVDVRVQADARYRANLTLYALDFGDGLVWHLHPGSVVTAERSPEAAYLRGLKQLHAVAGRRR